MRLWTKVPKAAANDVGRSEKNGGGGISHRNKTLWQGRRGYNWDGKTVGEGQVFILKNES